MLLFAVSFTAVVAVASCDQPVPTRGQPIVLAAADSDATFMALPHTVRGMPLRLYLDSGGGGPLIFADAAQHLVRHGKLTFACKSALPFATRFLIAPTRMRTEDPIGGAAIDGILGGSWLDGHVWTWDYLRDEVLLRARDDDPRVTPQHVVELGFQSYRGRHTTGFARIGAAVDGTTYQFLLDTGAHTRVVPNARAAGGFPSVPFATNFIEESIVTRWHRRHPAWRYVPHGEIVTRSAMIRVESVTIGGYRVGPAWFTARPDASYQRFMSSMMDAPVVGSIGGETLRHFRLTVDYVEQRAYFEL